MTFVVECALKVFGRILVASSSKKRIVKMFTHFSTLGGQPNNIKCGIPQTQMVPSKGSTNIYSVFPVYDAISKKGS
jgi:hypothetical protein